MSTIQPARDPTNNVGSLLFVSGCILIIMRYYILKMVAVCWLSLFLSSCQFAKVALPKRMATPTLSDPHQHIVNIEGPGLVLELAENLSIEVVVVNTDVQRDNLTENQAGSWLVFTIYDESFSIFIEDLENNQVYEIRGITQSWRPISDLVWVTNEILVFDQWRQPHHAFTMQLTFVRANYFWRHPLLINCPIR